MNRTKHKLLSGVLAAVLLLQTALPATVFAAEPAAKTIVGFSALEQTEYTLTVGADETAVNELLATFPKNITANVEYIVTEEAVDSGRPETLPPEDAAGEGTVEAGPPIDDDLSKSDTENPAAVLDSGVSGSSTQQPKATTGSNADEQKPDGNEEFLPDSSLPDTSLVEKVVSEQAELAVTWRSDKPLTTGKAGEFTYTAVLSDTDKGRYDFVSDGNLPELTVTVAEALAMMSPRAEIAATVNKNGVITNYETLQGAFNAVADGETIVLQKNLDEYVETQTVGPSFTLDLNGKTLTTSSDRNTIVHWNTSTLTIIDGAVGGGVTVGSIINRYAINNSGKGTVNIRGGTLTRIFCRESVVNISGGTVTGDEPAIYSHDNSTINISGGTIESKKDFGMDVISDSTINVAIAGVGTPVIVKGARGAMSNAPTLSADTVGWASENMSGTPLVPYNADNLVRYQYMKFVNNLNAASIGNTYYATLQAAINAVKADETIVLQKDLAEDVEIQEGRPSFTLDLNGKKLTESGNAGITSPCVILHNGMGKLTITDSAIDGGGTIQNTLGTGFLPPLNSGVNMCYAVINARGTLEVNGGTVMAKDIAVLNNVPLTINGGTVTGEISGITNHGTVNINGGTVTGKTRYAVSNLGGSVNISGGTLTSEENIGVHNQDGGTVNVTIAKAGAPAIIKGALGAMDTAPTLGADTVGQASTDVSGTPRVSYNAVDFASYKYMEFTRRTSSGGGSTGGGSSSSGGSSTGGSSSSSSGGSNATVTTPPAITPPATTKNPNPPTQGSITVPSAISGDTATVTVPTSSVKNAITKAQAEAKRSGKTDNGISVEIKADTKNAANLTATLPKAAVDALVSAGVKETRITSGVATISLNLDTLKEIQKQAGSDVTVTATKVANSALSNEAKSLVGNRPAYDLSITGKNGAKVTSFGKGAVSVSIPYALGANETAGNVVACYIDGTSNATELPNSVYDAETKTLSFVTSHFSLYAVGYKTNTTTFTDIADHWAKDSIEFVAARGLLAGTGEGKFSPNTSMTREMFVSALGKITTVNVSGIGNQFAADQAISREQMAVIMQNYAKATGFDLPKAHAQNTFADNAKINGYAKDAVKVMQMAGVLAGKSGNKFDPQGTATRAEVSAALKRFVELAISTDSTQGWMCNDSGKWMFFKGGRPVTGTKNIGGVRYTFNQNGETADLPKNRTYGSYTVKSGES